MGEGLVLPPRSSATTRPETGTNRRLKAEVAELSLSRDLVAVLRGRVHGLGSKEE